MHFQRSVLPRLAIVALASAAAGPGFAGEEELFQRLWADHLPAYCLYTQLLPDGDYGLYKSSTAKEYEKKYGYEAFRTLHHYCFGLEKTYQAATEEDERQRRFLYQSAVNEFDYVLVRTTDAFILKPEIYVSKGAALEVLGKYADAVQVYTEAIRLVKDYVPAYIGLSNCFETLGDPARALAIVESGLRHAPTSEILLGRRSALTDRAGVRPD